MNKPFYTTEEIPTEGRDKEFWSDITKENNKHLYNYIIISELRKLDPDNMSAVECRVAISKLKTLQNLLDFTHTIEEHRDVKVEPVKPKSSQQFFEDHS